MISDVNRQFLLYSLVVFSVILNIYSFCRPAPLTDILYQVLVRKNTSRIYFNTGLKRFLEQNVPDGNLFLKFRGYDTLKKESDIDSPILMYMWTCYTLYPRKTYAVRPDVIVNQGEDIISHPFNPDKRWIEQHGVKKIITFTHENGVVRFKIEQPDSLKK